MTLYLVTNKDTHARAVVSAHSAAEACELRPDSDLQNIVWRGGRWLKLGQTGASDRAAPKLKCWPDDIARVHADELGRPSRMWEGVRAVVVFDRDEQLRRPNEGPDASWGSLYTKFCE